jgi:hypothetical protein
VGSWVDGWIGGWVNGWINIEVVLFRKWMLALKQICKHSNMEFYGACREEFGEDF